MARRHQRPNPGEDLGPQNWRTGCLGVAAIAGVMVGGFLWLDASSRARIDEEQRAAAQAERERKAPLLEPYLSSSRGEIITTLGQLRRTCTLKRWQLGPVSPEEIIETLKARARWVARDEYLLHKALDAAATCFSKCNEEGDHACAWMQQFMAQLQPAPVQPSEPAPKHRRRTATPR